MRFDSEGNSASGAGADVRISGVGPGVADLALAATEAEVALAWSEAAASAGTLRAAWIGADAAVRTFELGPTFRDDGASRGALALVARDRGALLLSRGLPASCPDPRDRECSTFQFFELRADTARATGLPLTVPSPCPAHSAQLVGESRSLRQVAPRVPDVEGAPNAEMPSNSGHEAGVSARRSAAGDNGPLEYAICAGPVGASALTVFSIRQNPAYAAAEEGLAGCSPLGAGRFGGEATFVGVCAGQRRAVSVPAGGGALLRRDLDQRGLICNGDGAVLRFGSGWLRAREPLGNLELLSGDDLAPPGARAVWTGAALLVAQLREGRLSLSRHGCRDNRLVELDAPGDAGD